MKAVRSTERINEATADLELMKQRYKSCETSRKSFSFTFSGSPFNQINKHQNVILSV
jgi:hypothetical protein